MYLFRCNDNTNIRATMYKSVARVKLRHTRCACSERVVLRVCALLALAGPPSEITICTHTHTHTQRECDIDIMEEASTCSPVDMYIQGQLVMLTETVASMVASMVATPMM